MIGLCRLPGAKVNAHEPADRPIAIDRACAVARDNAATIGTRGAANTRILRATPADRADAIVRGDVILQLDRCTWKNPQDP